MLLMSGRVQTTQQYTWTSGRPRSRCECPAGAPSPARLQPIRTREDEAWRRIGMPTITRPAELLGDWRGAERDNAAARSGRIGCRYRAEGRRPRWRRLPSKPRRRRRPHWRPPNERKSPRTGRGGLRTRRRRRRNCSAPPRKVTKSAQIILSRALTRRRPLRETASTMPRIKDFRRTDRAAESGSPGSVDNVRRPRNGPATGTTVSLRPCNRSGRKTDLGRRCERPRDPRNGAWRLTNRKNGRS